MYHIFLFVEFLQIIFFAFYNFQFINEFIEPAASSVDDTASTPAASTNSTNEDDLPTTVTQQS